MRIKLSFLVILMIAFSFQVSAANKTVKLLTLEWEPYVGSEMYNYGYTAEIVTQAFKKAGYDVSIAFHAWDEAMAIAARGEADGVFPAYFEKSREKYFVFSDALAESPLGLCKRKYFQTQSPTGVSEKSGQRIEFVTDPRIDQTQALMDLEEFSFGVVKGYANTPEFDAANFLNKLVSNSDEDNMAKLLRRKVDLIVIDRYVARYILVKKFPWHSDKIEFMYPPLSVKELYLAISRNTANLEKKLSDFNAGLAILVEDGVLDKLKHRYGF
jgi:polar amino acid transport system substrate-binding protein